MLRNICAEHLYIMLLNFVNYMLIFNSLYTLFSCFLLASKTLFLFFLLNTDFKFLHVCTLMLLFFGPQVFNYH